jgi:Tfp pilus assembly protein PilN
MTQQINLCAPILLTPKRYFSAQAMLRTFVVFLVVLSATCSYWVWQLNAEKKAFDLTFDMQSRELKNLQASLEKMKLNAGSVAKGMAQDLQTQRLKLLQREQLLAAVNKGHFQPGGGHSSRLKLVAQSIPPKVWLTEIKADDGLLHVAGFTLETAVLNEWLAKLDASPILAGQKLSSIKVEQSAVPSAKPLWSFSFVSSLAKPLLPTGVSP